MGCICSSSRCTLFISRSLSRRYIHKTFPEAIHTIRHRISRPCQHHIFSHGEWPSSSLLSAIYGGYHLLCGLFGYATGSTATAISEPASNDSHGRRCGILTCAQDYELERDRLRFKHEMESLRVLMEYHLKLVEMGFEREREKEKEEIWRRYEGFD